MTDVAALERRLREVEDRLAIEALKHRYTAALDFGYDLEGLAACFVADGRWRANGFGDCRGRDEIKALFARVAAATPMALHYATSPRIDLSADGRSALARFYLLNLATVRSPGGEGEDAVVILGTYEDRCVKVGGEWLFEEVRVEVRSSSDWTEGWARQPTRP